MTHDEQRIWLIQQLLNEKAEYKNYKIPEDSQDQKNLLRALMNVRMPDPVSDEFLKIQDEYLQVENHSVPLTNVDDLSPCRLDKRIYLWQGDMTTLIVDAITNPANSALLGCFRALHNCADNIIHSKAGIELRLYCNNYMTTQAKMHDGYYEEPTGKAVITSGFNLPAKYVIHTVGPIVQPFLTEEHKKQLASCYTSCLNVASEYHLDSIAFCCISTGVFMFPQDKACEIAVKTVRDWLDQHPDSSVQKVVFNVYKDEDYRLYDARLNKKIHIR